MKRYRTPKAKPGELLVKYGQEHGDRDLYFCYGAGGATRRDSNVVMMAFNSELKLGNGNSLVKELEARGYDITTLKFTVQLKAHNVKLRDRPTEKL